MKTYETAVQPQPLPPQEMPICSINGEEVPEGSARKIMASPKAEKAADIAFVVEDANCNSKKDFTTMSKIIRGLLMKNGNCCYFFLTLF